MKKKDAIEVHVVKWRDACSGSGWETLEHASKTELAIVTTVGILLADEENRIIITSSIAPYGALAAIAIPHENIIDHQIWTL